MSQLSPVISIGQSQVPRYFYGTAWKEDATGDLTFKALQSGFRAIDTANQRKHYFEEAVGQAVKSFLETSGVKRDELFLQTKFTFARGQDSRKPYDENDSFSKQVADSFSSSLLHLGTDRIDSYVLHGPYSGSGITVEDLETWTAMEKLVESGAVRFLGVSNISASQLLKLESQVKVKPTFVQNRCFANAFWDRQVREVCKSKGIHYQGFSLLTANRRELGSPFVASLCEKYNKTTAQVVFRFSQQMNMICLTGTSSTEHMQHDLDIYDFELTATEMAQLEKIGT